MLKEYTEQYKGKEIKVSNSNGNGVYGNSLTNTPYSWEIWENGNKIQEHYRASSSLKGAIDYAKLFIK